MHRPQRSRIDSVFKWGLFGLLMWWIWAPVLLVVLIGLVLVFT